MSNGDKLGDRMKEYENATRVVLPRRLPMIVRVDGKAFHTFTRGFEKPWDGWFVGAMHRVAVALCEEVEGCQLAYWQSDEISLLVRDDMGLQTQPWFGKGLQKVVSVAAGVASAAMTYELAARLFQADETVAMHPAPPLPSFDARAFVLPPAEVVNYFIWRQQDAVRNSILGLGHAHFSVKEMHGLKTDKIQERLFAERGLNWNDTPTHLKRGACVRRVAFEVPGADGPAVRHRWEVDMETPTFTQDRGYIERHLADEVAP